MKLTITPQAAEKYLEQNTINRPLREPYVLFLAQEMECGNFRYNGEPLIFGKGNVLLDGQHRLHACVLAGVPFDTEVVKDVDPSVFSTIDQGEKRKVHDVLALEGHKVNRLSLASAVRSIINHNNGWQANRRGSAVEAVKFVSENPRIVDLVTEARAVRVIPASIIAVVGYYATETKARIPQWKAFVEGLASGENLSGNDPRLALRRAADAARLGAKGQGLRKEHMIAAVAQAWNAFANNQGITRLSYRRTARGRIVTPEICGQRTKVKEQEQVLDFAEQAA